MHETSTENATHNHVAKAKTVYGSKPVTRANVHFLHAMVPAKKV